jgi:hypothetical protein
MGNKWDIIVADSVGVKKLNMIKYEMNIWAGVINILTLSISDAINE